MKIQELRKKSASELKSFVQEQERRLVAIHMMRKDVINGGDQRVKPSAFRMIRRNVAWAKTLLREAN